MKRLILITLLVSCTPPPEQHPLVIAEGTRQICELERADSPSRAQELARTAHQTPGNAAVYVLHRDDEELVISIWSAESRARPQRPESFEVVFQAVR